MSRNDLQCRQGTSPGRAFAQGPRWLLVASIACAVAGARANEPTVDIVVETADTLRGLSTTMFTTPEAWREVARLNRLVNPNRIVPGQHLRVPARLLRSAPVGATVVSVTGDVRSNNAPVEAGAALTEGQALETGATGSAVIALADGSRVRLPPSSLAEVVASRNYGGRTADGSTGPAGPEALAARTGPWFAGTLRLLRGSVEVFASKVLRLKPLEIVTPTAVVGVRGTRYRVAFDGSVDSRSTSEVLEGRVRFDAAATPAGTDVGAGFGAALTAASAQPVVAALLPAPDLTPLPERFERPIVRFQNPAPDEAVRVQVAADAEFERLVSDQRIAAGGEVRIAGLDDARWFLRARRIGAQGIEGYDASRSFVLKARPEPPVYSAPRAGSKQSAGVVVFSWAPNVESPRARMQIARDPAFSQLVTDATLATDTQTPATLTEPGAYHWRLATLRASGEQGPFGDPQTFQVRALPEAPSAGTTADGSSLVFQWSGRPGDRHQVELARDADFKQIVSSAELSAPEWTLPRPASGGRYFFRYRSIESDGFTGPYSAVAVVDVPRDWSGLGLLLPLLLLL